MKRSGWRLALTAVLFLGWIGFLAYLAATTTNPVVLERPQFLTADLVVLADVDGARYLPTFQQLLEAVAGAPATTGLLAAAPPSGDGPGDVVTVRKVVWPRNRADLEGTKIFVKNLAASGVKHHLTTGLGSEWKLEWPGPGQYIFALSQTPDGPGVYQVTPEPLTPGFQPKAQTGAPIYPVNPDTLEQLEILMKQFHP
jgi:hypothetical protein